MISINFGFTILTYFINIPKSLNLDRSRLFNLIPIIIINWNGIIDTVECLDSVMKMKSDNFAVYLIDNNSKIDQQETLKKLYGSNEKINLRFNSKNLGFAKAHNKVWEEELIHLDLEYIVLLNNDTSVDENWFNHLIQFAEHNSAHVVSSKMINYYDRNIMDNAGHKMLNTGEIIPIGHKEPIENYNNSFNNMGACAGACLYSTRMLKDIGFFDPIFTTGYEDAELGLRAIVSKYSCIYCPEAIVYHKMGQSIKKVFNQEYSVMIQFSIIYSYFKLVPSLYIIANLPSLIFKYLMIFIIDIIFLRFQYLKVILAAIKKAFYNFSLIKEKRNAFYKGRNETITYLSFRKKLIFFLFFDIKRFYNLILKRNKSSIDNYI